LKLLLIMLVFLAPMLAAGVLTFSGWQPSGKAHGVPILPQRNFAEEPLPIRLENGQLYAWRDEQPRLTLLALAGPDCASRCLDTLTKLAAARITLNRNASRLRLLYLGQAPTSASVEGLRNYWLLGNDGEGKLAEFRPTTADSVSALLVESNGTALSFYPAGFDPTGLRQDLQRVIH
jgi:cytochrome oxidase Cu insertion factor (SCO1/SenC/PrrC family)